MATHRLFVRVTSCVLILAAGIGMGVGYMAVAATSGDTYNACITPQGDIYRVRKNASWSCLAGHTKISWNQQGPQGPAGVQGPPGDAAQTNVTIRSEAFTILAGTNGTASIVECAEGEEAIAGSYQTAETISTATDGTFPLVWGGPEVVDGVAIGWRFRFANLSGEDLDGTGYVTCLAP
jgi:hypothetical protein